MKRANHIQPWQVAYVIGSVLIVAGMMVSLAAPVPKVPDEDFRTFESEREFDSETIDRAKPLKVVEINRGERTETDKGWYAVWWGNAEGIMKLSTIPDGRLRYGYFSYQTGLPLDYRNEKVPAACAGCHNKNRER